MNKIFESSRIDSFTTIGDNVKVYKECDVQKSILNDYVSIGDCSIVRNSSLDLYVEIGRSNKILDSNIKKGTYTGTNTLISHTQIGKYCTISWNCSIGGANHDIENLSLSPMHRIFRDEPIKSFGSFNIPLEIGNDVWIASNVVITRGVKIGNGAVIAAGAVVTRDVPPYSIVGGVPAKVIRFRFGDEIIAKLEEIKW